MRKQTGWFLAGIVLLLAIALIAPRFMQTKQQSTGDDRTLVVYAYSSFPAEAVATAFEEQHDAELVFVAPGGASALLSRLVTEMDTGGSDADVFLGLADTSVSMALSHDVFQPYDPDKISHLQNIPAELLVDTSGHLLPFDYGYVTLIYNPDHLGDVAPPTSLEDLTDPRFENKIIMLDASSSTGQAFLMWTIATYGEEGYLDYWRRLKPNLLTITNSWSTGYRMLENGEAPIMVSYVTDRVAAVVYGGEPVHHVLTPQGEAYRQVELMGIVKGTKKTDLAHAFIDYVLSPEVQAQLVTANLMFPANSETPVPEVFNDHVVIPERPVLVDPAIAGPKLETWLRDWSRVIAQ